MSVNLYTYNMPPLLIYTDDFAKAVERLKKARLEHTTKGCLWDSDLVPEYRMGTHKLTTDWSLVAAGFVDQILVLDRGS